MQIPLVIHALTIGRQSKDNFSYSCEEEKFGAHSFCRQHYQKQIDQQNYLINENTVLFSFISCQLKLLSESMISNN